MRRFKAFLQAGFGWALPIVENSVSGRVGAPNGMLAVGRAPVIQA